VIAPGDDAAFAEAVRALADDPARRVEMGRRARQAGLGFDRRRMVGALAAAVEDVVSGRPEARLP
jgi:glycosyltransferase involved in cell wall biosynthesis